MTESDRPFVLSSWFKSHWKAVRNSGDFNAYERVQTAAMGLLLRDAATVIAYLPSAPDEILGYAISEPGILHYIYVKKDYRNLGVGTELLPPDVHTFTFRGRHDWYEFRTKRIPEAKFSSQYVPAVLLGEADRVRQTDALPGPTATISLVR
jgi:GNAT superfamily N-acetyltransferase